MFIKAIFTGVAIAIASTAATASFAGTCKDVNIVAHNKTGKQIKVIDMYYRTYTAAGNEIQKREETVKNATVNANTPFASVRNLEGANGLKTKLFIEYRVRNSHSGWNQWTNVKRESSSKFDCYRYADVIFDLKKK